LDVPHPLQLTLNNADLNSPTGLQNAIVAAKVLQRAMNAELKPGINISAYFNIWVTVLTYAMGSE